MNVMRRTSHPSFRLWTFGPWRIERQTAEHTYTTVPLTELGGTFSRFVLLSLACAPDRTLRRSILLQRVAGPDDENGGALSPEQMAARLRDAIRYLNKVFCHPATAKGWIVFEKDTQCYRLPGQEIIWVDADFCLDTLECVQSLLLSDEAALPLLEEVAGYYEAGTFLEEEEVDWVMGKRATLETVRPTALRLLIDIYERENRFLKAEYVLRRIIEKDPTDEEAFCRMAVTLMKQGKHAEAIKLAEMLQQRLEKEEISFTTATHHLLNQINKHWSQRKISMLDTGEAPLFVPSLAHVIQLPQTQNAAFGEGMPDASNIFLPSQPRLLLPPSPNFSVVPTHDAAIDLASWFAVRLNDLKAVGASWQGVKISCQQQQGTIHAELERWNAMTDYTADELRITRRTALAMLAMLPTSLMTRVQMGPLNAIVVEEFLMQVTTSITTCWTLLNGNGLSLVERTLPTYLPTLLQWARQPSSYQQKAAYLAAQGSLLMNMVSYHRFRTQDSLSYATQAVELANIAGDRNLQIYALVLQGGAFGTNGQNLVMLEKHQQAERSLNDVVPALRSSVLMELAYSYAKNGQVQEALKSLGEAQSCFPDDFAEVPCFVSATYNNRSQLILFEGITYLTLGMHTDQTLAYNAVASKALEQIEKVPPTLFIPDRTRFEIVNYRAEAALGEENMEKFVQYFIEGAEGAEKLGSQKRWQEVRANWKSARRVWPNEGQILQLAERLF